MKRFLSDEEQKKLDQRISAAEKRTGAQIVLAVTERADSYPEIPWKAFALGSSIAALITFIMNALVYTWPPIFTLTKTTALIIGAGALLALITTVVPKFARLFLPAYRIETEVLQYAESLFLERELFATKERNGVLFLISIFERQVLILPDTGVGSRLKEEARKDIIKNIAGLIAKGEIYEAFGQGLEQMSLSLGSSDGGTGNNELTNDIIQEDGDK